MSRIPTPATIEAAPAAVQSLLEGVKKQLGVVPNMFRLIANSPAALESYLELSGALTKGTLPAPTRERIALAVAEINGCTTACRRTPISARLSPSSTMPKLLPTATAPRTIPRQTPRCALRSRSCASAVMSVKTMSTPSNPPATAMRR
jgi:hypothetical protein